MDAQYPYLSALISSSPTTAPPNVEPPPDAAARILLHDPNMLQLMLNYHAHRNEIRRALSQCSHNGEHVPPALMKALEALLNEEAHSTSIVNQNTFLSPVRRELPTSASSVFFSPIRSPPSIAATATTPTNQKHWLEKAHEAQREGRHREQIESLVELLAEYRKAPGVLDRNGMFRVMRRLGDAHLALQEHESAEQYFFEWYIVAQRANDVKETILAMTNLGKTRQAVGDFSGAQQWFEKAASAAKM